MGLKLSKKGRRGRSYSFTDKDKERPVIEATEGKADGGKKSKRSVSSAAKFSTSRGSYKKVDDEEDEIEPPIEVTEVVTKEEIEYLKPEVDEVVEKREVVFIVEQEPVIHEDPEGIEVKGEEIPENSSETDDQLEVEEKVSESVAKDQQQLQPDEKIDLDNGGKELENLIWEVFESSSPKPNGQLEKKENVSQSLSGPEIQGKLSGSVSKLNEILEKVSLESSSGYNDQAEIEEKICQYVSQPDGKVDSNGEKVSEKQPDNIPDNDQNELKKKSHKVTSVVAVIIKTPGVEKLSKKYLDDDVDGSNSKPVVEEEEEKEEEKVSSPETDKQTVPADSTQL